MSESAFVPAPFRMGAHVVIFNDHGEVLLVRQGYDSQRYGLPGGGVVPGELPQAAAIRETREEAGVMVSIDRLISLASVDTGGLIFTFQGSLLGGHLTVPPTGEIIDVGWFPVDHLPAPIYSGAHLAIADAHQQSYGILRDITLE